MSFNKQNYVGTPEQIRTAFEVQKDLAQASVLHSEIVWDVYVYILNRICDFFRQHIIYASICTCICVIRLGPDQSKILIKKLDCLFPDDTRTYYAKKDIRKVNTYNANLQKVKAKLFHNIWKQRKYTSAALLHSIVYIIVSPELNVEEAKLSHNYTIHPIFRTRRCLNDNSSVGCCMIFIDEKSRIYQNWNDFINNNELPYGIMIAPKDGCYSFDEDNMVHLEYSFTPAYVYNALNTMDNVISYTSIVGQTATFLHPLFTIITIGAKTYETIRNYQKMSDKVAKGTTTNGVANLSLTSDIIGLTSSAATFGAHMYVAKGGELSLAAGLSIQTINGAAALTNCTKLITTIYDLFTRYFVNEEEVDFKDLLAFGSSLILFTNSINNIVITSQVGNVDGNTLRNLLQSNIRAGLSFVLGEVVKYNGANDSRLDLLRLVNDIPYKDVLNNMHKVYKNLSRSGFLTTLSLLSTAAKEIIPGIFAQVVNKEITNLDLKELSKHYGSKFVQHIANCHNFIDVLNAMGMYFSTTVVQFLFNQTRIVIETPIDDLGFEKKSFVSTEMILYKIFCNLIQNYDNCAYEFLHKKRNDILSDVKNFLTSLNPNTTNANTEKYNCEVCGGYYYLQLE